MSGTNEAGKFQERYLDKSRRIVSKYLQELDELPGAPEEFEYFKQILKEVFIENKPVAYGGNETFVGSFCVMMPQELVYAAGARPLRLCSGNYVGFHIGDYMTPRDVCPLVKSVVGNTASGINGIYDACGMFVVPLTCDCKKKLAGKLSEFKDTVPLYVPLNKTDDEGMETYIQGMKAVVEKISEKTGVKITRESLAEQIKIMAEAQKEIRRFIQLKDSGEILIRGSHAMAIMNTLAYDHIQHWCVHLKKLNEELLKRKEENAYLTKKKLPRILLTGSPVAFPNLKIPLLIEEQGGIIAGDETCLGDRAMLDPVSVCDDSLSGYYRALANRYVKPCSCPVFPDNRQRIRRLEKMVKDGHIEGIIYHVLRGCLVYDYEYLAVEKHFTEKGIPVIRVESDYNEEDVEQLRIRIEAFIEMIKFKHKKSNAME